MSTQTTNLKLTQPVIGDLISNTIPAMGTNFGTIDTEFGQRELNVKSALFGAKGDGVTDDTAAIQAAINAISSNGAILKFPAGTYMISSGLHFNTLSNITITGPNATIKYLANTADTLYSTWPNYGNDSIFRFLNCNNVLVDGLTLHGNLSNRTAHAGGESFNGGILLLACTNVTVRKCYITESMTDGITMQYDSSYSALCTNIYIENCLITKSRRNGIGMTGQDGAVITDCIIDSIGTIQGTSPKNGIDIEPDQAAGMSKNVVIRGNKISNCANYGMSSGGMGTENLRIVHNSFVANVTGLDMELYSTPTGAVTTNVIVSDNVFENHTYFGIRQVGVTCDVISDNVFRNNQYGINSYSADGLLIRGNKFIKNNHGGITANTFVRLLVDGNLFLDNNSTQGQTDGAGWAFYATPTDSTSIVTFNNNFMHNSVGQTPLMNGAEVVNGSYTPISRANGNVAKNLYNNNNGWVNFKGYANISIDGTYPYNMGSDDMNFTDNAGGGHLFIQDKRHYGGTAAPTTGTWNVGDIVYNTSPAASGNIGWVCVTAGTPGTWKTFGSISA